MNAAILPTVGSSCALYYPPSAAIYVATTRFNYDGAHRSSSTGVFLSLQGGKVGGVEREKSLNEKRLEKQTRCKESCSAMSNT